MLMEDHVPLN